jgi:ketosteroid isomerase-like protein
VKIRTIVALAGLLLVLTEAVMASAARSSTGPLDTVRNKFDAFNRHDVAMIEQIYAGTATLHSPDYANLEGNGPIADTYRKLFAAIPDAKDTLKVLERSASHVYAQFVLSGHWKGEQDQPVTVRIISVYTVKGGRIVEDSTYYDRKMP